MPKPSERHTHTHTHIPGSRQGWITATQMLAWSLNTFTWTDESRQDRSRPARIKVLFTPGKLFDSRSWVVQVNIVLGTEYFIHIIDRLADNSEETSRTSRCAGRIRLTHTDMSAPCYHRGSNPSGSSSSVHYSGITAASVAKSTSATLQTGHDDSQARDTDVH